jgi:hypothetical protein
VNATSRIVILLLAALVAAGAWLGGELGLPWLAERRFDSVVVHHSASASDTYESIRRYHATTRGWSDAAYHLILSNGRGGVELGVLEPTGRYRRGSHSVATRDWRRNVRSLHLCVVGNYESSRVSPDMRRAIGSALGALLAEWNLSADDVLLHRDLDATACPGRHITREHLAAWVEEARAEPPAFAADHAAVAAGSLVSPSRARGTGTRAGMIVASVVLALGIGGAVLAPRPSRRTRRASRARNTA